LNHKEIAKLRAELAAIRAAFPKNHPAHTDGDMAEGVRELVSSLAACYRLRRMWKEYYALQDDSIERKENA